MSTVVVFVLTLGRKKSTLFLARRSVTRQQQPKLSYSVQELICQGKDRPVIMCQTPASIPATYYQLLFTVVDLMM